MLVRRKSPASKKGTDGLKAMVAVQVPPGARDGPHVVLSRTKSPMVLTPFVVNVTVELPEFVTVTVCAALVVPLSWLPKLSDAADRVSADPVTPVALSATICRVLKTPLSAMVICPEISPGDAAGGVTVTPNVQMELAGMGCVQLLSVTPKFAEGVMLLIDSAAEPRFSSVTVMGKLATPVACEPKLMLAGKACTSGTDTPNPSRGMVIVP